VTAHNFDVLVIGAGSVGLPIALCLARDGLKTAVIEKGKAAGQGQNKAAIGGIRATHSHRAKIWLCQNSLDIFSNWQERYGDNILWRQGGYLFPVYTSQDKDLLQKMLTIQHQYGLNIKWTDSETVKNIVTGINSDSLLGGTFSPEDGSASPINVAHAFWRQAREYGAQFFFGQQVKSIQVNQGKVSGVRTQENSFSAPLVINAAGVNAKEIGEMVGLDFPVQPDSHEAGITEPTARFMDPMVVDIRPDKGSSNFYFYQNHEGQIIFCMTPSPLILGNDQHATSEFLPLVSRRLITLAPRLSHLRVRRTWRGLYPMTPDGFPIVGAAREVEGFYFAVGMCGQGFMLGPGIGELISRLARKQTTDQDQKILNDLTLYGDFKGGTERLK